MPKYKNKRIDQDNHDISIKGSPPLHSETKFSVQVTDVNDVRPQFRDQTIKLSIAENQKAKSPVGWINATDTDLGPGLTYSLITSNKEQFFPFRISDNGLISTIMSLDHEFQKVYKFKVLVEDNGVPSLNNTVNVEIEVIDENDNAPYFTFPSVTPYSMDIVFSPQHSENITVLKASDKDSLENAFLKYDIIAGNKAKLFKLNRYTGLLSFNREIKPQDAGLYVFQFSVKDSGIPVLSASTNLSLTVIVSNVTYEYVLNSTKPQVNDRIHQYLLIVIVLVAVTLAVPITAGFSICCLRCNDRSKATRKAAAVRFSKKTFNEQRHLIVHPHLAAAWSDAPVVRSSTPKRGKKNSALTMKLQKVTDAIYQEIDDIDMTDQSQFMIPDTHRTLLPSRADREDAWTLADIGGLRLLSDLTADYIEPCPPNRDETQSRYMEPIQKRFFFPEDKVISSRRFSRPNIAHVPDCTQWVDASPSTMDSGIADIQ